MPSSPKAGASSHVRAGDVPDLMTALGRVPDPRARRGRRYPLAGLLAVAVSAVTAGAKSFTAIGEWAAALSTESLAGFGLQTAPEASNLRKLFARVDGTALDAALAVFTWMRVRNIGGRRVVAIDGKTGGASNARRTGRRARRHGVVWARQWTVNRSAVRTSSPDSCADLHGA